MHYYDDDEITTYQLAKDVLCASSIAYFLWLATRVARGLVLAARVDAYDELSDAYTPEEREVLIHRIKKESLRH
jgi:hypothetical protein